MSEIQYQTGLLEDLKRPLGEQTAETLRMMIPSTIASRASEKLQLEPSIAQALLLAETPEDEPVIGSSELKVSEEAKFLLCGGPRHRELSLIHI